MPQYLDQNHNPVPGAFRMKPGSGQTVAYTGTAGTIANPVGQTQATTTLTSNNTTPSDGDKVAIGGQVYTFKTALTPAGGEVLIAGSADAALLNLIRCINHTGTPGTDYANSGIGAAASTLVSAAASVTNHAFLITVLAYGSAGNGLSFLTPAGTTLSFSTPAGGSDNARNTRLVRVLCTTAAFIRVGVSPTAVAADYPVAANVPENIPIYPGEKVSAIQVASGGNLYVHELD
jgi:hypothetical protein